MEIKWSACLHCGVNSYEIHGDGADAWTTFNRGCYLVHQNNLVTGLPTREKAEEWLIWLQGGQKWPTPGRNEASGEGE